MNTPVRRVALAVMGMIVLLMANLTYVQVVKAGDYRDDSRNKRVLLAEYARKRGQISAGGQVLARQLCLDPSDFLNASFALGRAAAACCGSSLPLVATSVAPALSTTYVRLPVTFSALRRIVETSVTVDGTARIRVRFPAVKGWNA